MDSDNKCCVSVSIHFFYNKLHFIDIYSQFYYNPYRKLINQLRSVLFMYNNPIYQNPIDESQFWAFFGYNDNDALYFSKHMESQINQGNG